MTTLIYSHPDCLRHCPPTGHPEHPGRLSAVLEALEALDAPVRREAPRASRDHLRRVHPDAHIRSILDEPVTGGLRHIDPDTALSEHSASAALHAAGAVVAAVDAVMDGAAANAFCAVRPPGHHAEPDRAMGFCLFNNIAVGALHARAAHGLERVAVVDFDVHHGNGTQAAFHDLKDMLYISTHQSPLYPGTGHPGERGKYDNILNVTLPPGAGSVEFRAAFSRQVMPKLDAFRPQFLFISAGFDAHADDPLAQLAFTTDDFLWATRQLTDLAQRHCQGRVVSALEGGYHLGALADSARAHVKTLIQAGQQS